MTTLASDLIDLVRRHQVTMTAAGDKLKIAAPCKPPDDVIDALRSHRSELLAALAAETMGTAPAWDVIDWKAFYDERAGIRECDGNMPRPAAEAGAYQECLFEWLNRNPPPSSPDRCASCGQSGASVELLHFATGTRFRLHLRCQREWGATRVNHAKHAILAVGIKP